MRMKKIIYSILLAVSLLAFIGCNNGHKDDADANLTPAELLKNLPVTTADFANMIRAATDREAASSQNGDTLSQSDMILLVLKHCISEVEGFELGENKKIGVIGDFSTAARNEFLKFYDENYVDGLFESFAVRDFGTVNVSKEDNYVTIYWYMPAWSPNEDITFPASYLYAYGRYYRGKYEHITIYGENYHYCYKTVNNGGKDHQIFDKAVPIYEKTYIVNDKVISLYLELQAANFMDNEITQTEVTATGSSKSKVPWSSDSPTEIEIEEYCQEIQDWYKTVN